MKNIRNQKNYKQFENDLRAECTQRLSADKTKDFATDLKELYPTLVQYLRPAKMKRQEMK